MSKSGFLLAVLALILNACASSKDIIYFQGNAIPTTVYEEDIPTLQAGDNISINVTGSDSRTILPFNQVGDDDLKDGGYCSGCSVKGVPGFKDDPSLSAIRMSGPTWLNL